MLKFFSLFLPNILGRRTLWPLEGLKRNLLDEEFYDRETMPINLVYDPPFASDDFTSICESWMSNIYEFYSQSSYDDLTEAEKDEEAFYEFYCEDDLKPGADFYRARACQEYIRVYYFNDENATTTYEENGGKCSKYFGDDYEMEPKVQEMLENLMFRSKFTALDVEAGIEIQSINEVMIHESSMDSTIIIYLSWSDPRLIWDPKDNNQIFSIYVPYEKIWTPPIEIVNLDKYLNYGIIFKYDAKISNNGDISTLVKMRVSTSCDITQKLYPFDLQECSIEIATPILDTELLNFKVKTWNSMQKNPVGRGRNETNYNETDLASVKNTFFDDNPEWEIAAFKYEVSNSVNNINQKFSKLSTTFFLQRQIAFYEITLLLPIVCLNILVCVGLWIPISSGENISYQVTMLLTIVVYLEVLSSSIPVFRELGNAPQLLILFIISIIASVAAMIILAGTAWLHEKQYDQMYCFSRGRARFAYYSAKFYQSIHGDRYLIPEVILKCLKHKIDNSKERLAINLEMKKSSEMDPDDWNIAWRFYGKMISHLCAICLTLCVSVASLSVIITIHMKNNTGKSEFQTSP